MDFLGISLRMAMGDEERFLPYAFEGDWTEEEKQVIRDAIDSHVPAKVDAMFNNWMFWAKEWNDSIGKKWFSAKRATWEMLWGADNVEDMAKKVTDYYSR